MVTYSPRVEFRLAGSCQARLPRRHMPQPAQAIPASPTAHVDGSGTGTGLARRKPLVTLSTDGESENLSGDGAGV